MITANLPMFTMKSYVDDRSNATYSVVALQTNMYSNSKRLTMYRTDIIFQDGEVKTIQGYSTKQHMDVFQYAKSRAKKFLK